MEKEKLMGFKRKVGSDGGIIIPEEFRKRVGIKPEMRIKMGVKDHEIFIRKEENFIEWLEDRVKRYGRDLSKLDLKKVYES